MFIFCGAVWHNGQRAWTIGSDSPGLSPGSCVYYVNALGSLLNLSEPQFHHQGT